MRYRFEDCEFDTDLHVLLRQEKVVHLRPKVFQTLQYLLENHERVVSKDELYRNIWPDQFVGDAVLERTISEVRNVVGDNGRKRRIIQTLHSHGYRFVASLSALAGTMQFPQVIDLLPECKPLLSLSCPACQQVSPGHAAFCMACGVRLQSRCASCGQLNALDEGHCSACGTPKLASLPALVIPPHVIPMPLHGESKVVTSLCCALVFPPTLMVHDLERLHQQMQTLHREMLQIVGGHDGVIHTMMPGQILAVFGAPLAQEEHTWQAVLAAFALQQRLAGLRKDPATTSDILELRIGIHTGTAVVGGFTGAADTPLSIIGESVSIATVLQQQAEPGTIVCSAETARLLQGVVRMHETARLKMPGYPSPLRTYRLVRRVLWRTPRSWRVVRPEHPFIGRMHELQTLQAAWRQVKEGRGHVIGLVGEPGLGKSRLLYAFRQWLRRDKALYLTGGCHVHGQTTPYLPILDLLRHHCGILATDTTAALTTKVHQSLREIALPLQDWAPYLLSLLGVPDALADLQLPPTVLKTRLHEALLSLCLHGSQRLPLILEIEDIHWIDAASEECLGALVERIVGVPILLLLTYRPGYRPPWLERSYVTQLALSRLSPRESAQMVQKALQPFDLSATQLQELLLKAEGNPLFLEEVTRMIREHSVAGALNRVPDSVQSIIAFRIDRLPAAAKQLLQAAAVFGKDVPVAWLRTAFPDIAMPQSLSLLQHDELLHETAFFPESVYTFHHGLTQEVAYRSLLHKTRQEFHSKIAAMFVQDFPEICQRQPELVAHHYSAGGDSLLAIPYWQQASQQAMRRAASSEAAQYLQRGLELLQALPESPQRTDHEINLGMLLSATGRRRPRPLPFVN